MCGRDCSRGFYTVKSIGGIINAKHCNVNWADLPVDLVTVNALDSTYNVTSFMTNWKTTMTVYHIMPDIQDGGQKPEVQITFV